MNVNIKNCVIQSQSIHYSESFSIQQTLRSAGWQQPVMHTHNINVFFGMTLNFAASDIRYQYPVLY
jgi:hypothetical protein